METSRYERPTNPNQLTPDEKAELLQQYFSFYERLAKQDSELLNVKLERSAVEDLLDEIGALLLERSQMLACSPGPLREFLHATEVPECLKGKLPDDFRAFCLILNALKQWVAAESAATDRYLLGGTARQQCRKVADHCLVTGNELAGDIELHHPARDGRPPIPLSKPGHDKIEQQTSDPNDPVEATLRKIKTEGNRSWVMLRRGCLALLGRDFEESSESVLSGSKTFARKAAEATGLSYDELISWLDEHKLA